MSAQVTYHLEVFDGPLDLLLHLISKNKINIYDIPISLILDQYLSYIDSMKAMDLSVTSDFIAMAANLLYLKSKMLLPIHSQEEEDPRNSLVEALLEYERFKKATFFLLEKSETGRDIFTKLPELMETDKEYPYSHSEKELIAALLEITEKSGRRMPPPVSSFTSILQQRFISIDDKVEEILNMFFKNRTISFMDIIKKATDRAEMIAYFLALLELQKDNRIYVRGQGDGYSISLNNGKE